MTKRKQVFQYEFPRPAVSVDVVVLDQKKETAQILLIERGQEPFKGYWALPGGFLEMDETLDESARRELLEETNIKVTKLQQIGVFSAVNRDPRGRVISVGYLAILNGQNSSRLKAGDDARSARWFELKKIPRLAFDHSKIVQAAIQSLKGGSNIPEMKRQRSKLRIRKPTS